MLLHRLDDLLNMSHPIILLASLNDSSSTEATAAMAWRDPEVFILGQRKGVTPALRRDIRRRAAIEPVIGHMKSDGRLARCPLKGTEGEMFHAIMCGCGQNIRMILR